MVTVVFMLLAAGEVDAAIVLDTLRADHPRLMLTAEELDALKAAEPSDPALSRMVAQVIEQADKTLDAPVLEHKLVGPRLLHVSRDCLRRVYTLGLAWRWTGDERYARGAESNLLTVSDFPDWNPSHFLDTAEMTHATAVGYDWLFHWLSEDSRARIKTAIVEKGLKPGLIAYEEGHWWTKSEFNWNNVCNAGMVVGALAIAETDPNYAETIVPRAVASLPPALDAYNPDGAWMEGPGY